MCRSSIGRVQSATVVDARSSSIVTAGYADAGCACLSSSALAQPRDHEDIRGPMPVAIERGIAFIDRNTRHPMKVVGLNA